MANTKILTTKSILPECQVKPFFSNISTDYIEVYWEEYDKKRLHGHFKGQLNSNEASPAWLSGKGSRRVQRGQGNFP